MLLPLKAAPNSKRLLLSGPIILFVYIQNTCVEKNCFYLLYTWMVGGIVKMKDMDGYYWMERRLSIMEV